MKDIVEAALEHQDDLEVDAEPNANEFGEPQVALIGYGNLGAEIIQQGWDSRYPNRKYPEAHTHHVQCVEELPESTRNADYVILTGSANDHRIAAEIGDALSRGTTSIAIPIRTTANPIETPETINATIPCNQTHVQELATDLLTILAGRIEISPHPRFYNKLRTIGRIHGFRGQQGRDSSEISQDEFAEQLVADTLANPVDYEDSHSAEHYISFLHAGEGLTLGEAEAVRNEIATELGVDMEKMLLAVDATKEMGTKYRLIVLCA